LDAHPPLHDPSEELPYPWLATRDGGQNEGGQRRTGKRGRQVKQENWKWHAEWEQANAILGEDEWKVDKPCTGIQQDPEGHQRMAGHETPEC